MSAGYRPIIVGPQPFSFEDLLKNVDPAPDEETERFIAWGKPDGGAGIGLIMPYDGKPATVGNGVMVGLAAKDKAQVDRIYKLALSMGGTDEGPPGPRGDGFYAGYFRDPDGNKLNAFVMG